MEKATKYIGQTREFSFFSDGERRYGNALFELCSQARGQENQDAHESPFQKESEFVLKTRESKNTKKGKTSKIPAPQREHPDRQIIYLIMKFMQITSKLKTLQPEEETVLSEEKVTHTLKQKKDYNEL